MSLLVLGLIYGVRVQGPITPPLAQFLKETVRRAEREGADAILVALDTPGGLLDATRVAVGALMESRVPVVVWVGPPGARAASAGVFLLMAADVAACAPGTNFGAAHPVALGEGDSVALVKAEEDAASWLRSIMRRRGRPVQWADSMVRASRSFTPDEALRLGLLDLVAENPKALVDSLVAREVIPEASEIEWAEMGFFDRLLFVLANPNVAYILLMLGIYGLLFEIMHPGAIFPGVLGSICLVLALYSFQALPVNWAALILVLLGVGMLVAEIKVASHGVLGTGGVVSLLLGSAMLFRGEGYRVSWSLILSFTLLTVVFLGSIVYKALRAQAQRPQTGPEAMLGKRGVAKVGFAQGEVGQVLVHGELWRARTLSDLSPGDEVVVVGVEGLLLIVDSPHPRESPPAT